MKWKKETWLTVLVFIFIAASLIIIESRPGFPDPDSFYHAKMALTIRDQGFLKIFPWFQWTDLKNVYVNPHLLYHILLIPFVTVFSPMAGMKISAVVFGLIAFASIFLVLKSFKTPSPAFFLLLSSLSFGLMHRVSLPRAPALSIALLLLATWAMLKRRTWILFFVSIIFVWFYHGWPIILLSLGAVTVAGMLANQLTEQKKIWSDLFKGLWQERKNWLATFGGLIFGLVVNPYFPQNIEFSILDIFKIGVVNYQNVIAVGNEWLPKTPGEFIASTALVFAAFLLSVAFFVPGLLTSKIHPTKEELIRIFALVFLAGGYSSLCFKSSRYIEYAAPFLTLAAGSLTVFALPFLRQKFWPIIQSWLAGLWIKKTLAIIFILSLLVALAFRQTVSIAEANDNFQAAQYEPATNWIKENVPNDEIIFHSSWDYSLILWYLDDNHRYLMGLDPTFMYDYDPETYGIWWKLITAEDPDVSKIISVFNSNTVIVDIKKEKAKEFIKNLEVSGLFHKVVDGERVKVFSTSKL